ncbi:MAG: hypothetical protein FJZ05_01030 [Candidatus Nealsonbacteria bacterium]|nr:hypothetical protein [Candidatus Nealsonbacteria bacterium]
MKKFRIFSFLLILIFFLIIAGFVFAQRSLEIEYPEAGGLKPETTLFGLSAYVKYIFNLSIIIAGLIAFGGFVFGGIRYITSAGVPAYKKDASEQMFAAFIGILVLLTSYMLLTSINPELTMLAAPEITESASDPIITPTIEEETLSYTEIPISALIQELFLEIRLNNLKNFSKKVKDKSQLIKQKTEELDSLIVRCTCSKLQSSCSTISPISQAACEAGSCHGNPCSDKDKNLIKNVREEIQKLVDDEKDGLTYWQKKLDREINGSTEEEDEYVGFRQVYEDLLSAEEMMKDCSNTYSANGKSQFLVAYNDFWIYRQYMADRHNIKDFKRETPFEYIYLTGNPLEQSTFYCTEMLYNIIPIEIDESWIEDFGKEQGKFEEGNMCGNEIYLGKNVDSSEELAKRMLKELDNINDNAKKEITDSKNSVDTSDPDNCIISNCSHQCVWIERWDPVYNCIRYNEDDECEEYEENWVDHSYCQSSPCIGSECPGEEPKKSQFRSILNRIKKYDSEISSSYTKLVNLIQGNVDDEYLIIPNIFKSLGIVQNQIIACHNPEESYIKFEAGLEGISWRELFSCYDILAHAIQEIPFYNKDGKAINKCYGKTAKNPDFMDNLFCCEGGYSPQ